MSYATQPMFVPKVIRRMSSFFVIVAFLSAHTVYGAAITPRVTAKKTASVCIADATAARAATISAARKRLKTMIASVKNQSAQRTALKSYSKSIKAADVQLAAATKKCRTQPAITTPSGLTTNTTGASHAVPKTKKKQSLRPNTGNFYNDVKVRLQEEFK